ncbi:MAG: thiamine phosphate synthase [Duncaniella sp.]|nr:thiamine phosphate synthase [Duncaniella sp.]
MLQFITHRTPLHDEMEGAIMALEGGCRWIQLRMKDAEADEIERTARMLLPVCRRYGAKLILDDHVMAVKATGADGVHLGKADMPVDEARRILGGGCIIGATANNYDDIVQAVGLGADYIGLGPYRFTTTKKKLSPILGTEGYRMIMEQCARHGVKIPVVAIGGITLEDVSELMRTGITGVAVSGCVLTADNPTEYTRRLLAAIIE